MIESESPTPATAKFPLNRIPPLVLKIVFMMLFGGLMGAVFTCPGTPTHQASILLLGLPMLVVMSQVVVRPAPPKWEWMGRPIDRLAFIWLPRLGFVVVLIVYVLMAIKLAHTLLAS